MAIPTIPSASEIKARIVSDLEASLNQTTPSLPKSFNNVLAGAIAGVILLLYQAILWTYRQIFPDSANLTALKLLGSLVDVEQLSAEFAVLTADVGGTDGETASQGTTFLASNGLVYKIEDSVTITSGFASVSLKCQTSGEDGNLSSGTILDIISPDPVLTGTATITGTTTSGDDEETDDAFRVRVSAAYKKRKTGGSPVDYEAWAYEAPNVSWVNPVDDDGLPGIPVVYIKVDNQDDGIPDSDQLTEVQNYLLYDPDTGLRDRHPIGPWPDVRAITRKLFDITITIQGGTSSVKTSIEQAVTDYLESKVPYNEAVSLTRDDTISSGGISSEANDIATEEGQIVTAVTLVETSLSTTIPSYTLYGGELGKVNSITWVDVT